MNPILQALQNIFGQQKLISPLPASESPGGINDPTQAGLNYYYQREIQPYFQQPQQQNNGFSMQSIGQALSTLGNGSPQKAFASDGNLQSASDYQQQAAKIFNKYGVPSGVGLGIWAMEGRGKTINPNNPYNIGAYDTNPQNANAYQFKDPLEGTDEAAKFLAGKSQFQTPQVQKIFQQALNQYKKTGNQGAYLQAIAPTYSSNPQYAQTIMQTPEYQKWSKKN